MPKKLRSGENDGDFFMNRNHNFAGQDWFGNQITHNIISSRCSCICISSPPNQPYSTSPIFKWHVTLLQDGPRPISICYVGLVSTYFLIDAFPQLPFRRSGQLRLFLFGLVLCVRQWNPVIVQSLTRRVRSRGLSWHRSPSRSCFPFGSALSDGAFSGRGW